MDALEILKILLRRWWVVVPVLALALGGAWYVTDQAPPEYSRQMSVLVIGPAELATEEPTRSNPYRGVGLDTTAQALTIVGNGGPTSAAAAAAGVTAGYEFASTRNSPIIRVTATADTPQDVVEALTFLLDRMETELEDRQDEAGAPAENRISLDVLDPPNGPVAIVSDSLRIQLAMLAAGLLLATLAAVAVDRLLAARRSAAARRRPPVRATLDTNGNRSADGSGNGVGYLPEGRASSPLGAHDEELVTSRPGPDARR